MYEYAPDPITLPILSTSDIKRIQEVVGTLLYYALTVNPTMLSTLNDIGSQQVKATKLSAQHLCQLLDYAASNPNAIIRYKASGMILQLLCGVKYQDEPFDWANSTMKEMQQKNEESYKKGTFMGNKAMFFDQSKSD